MSEIVAELRELAAGTRNATANANNTIRRALDLIATLQGERDAARGEVARLERDKHNLSADLAGKEADCAMYRKENERLRAALRKLLDEDDVRAAREALGEKTR